MTQTATCKTCSHYSEPGTWSSRCLLGGMEPELAERHSSYAIVRAYNSCERHELRAAANMSAQPTSGPWGACERGDYTDDGIVILGDDRRIAVVNRDGDARLIAAAPELLSNLEFAVKLLAPFGETAQVAHMRTVIAKATGGAA